MTRKRFKAKTKLQQKAMGKFRSIEERDFFGYLTDVLGIKALYEPTKVPYVIPEIRKNYIPDFIVDPKSHRKIEESLTFEELQDKILIEYKGRFTAKDQKKMKLVKLANPDLDIRFVFSNDRIMDKRRKSRRDGEDGLKKTGYRYSDWCLDNGFPFYIGKEPPKEWFK
jgi:hypothetical protein